MHMTEVLAFWGFFAAIFLIVWSVTSSRRRQKMAETQAEMQAKLLDKLSASQDLAEYLKTEAGQRLLTNTPVETKSPFGRILGSIQAGTILTLLGMALLILSVTIADAEQGLTVIGTISLAVGLGFLSSALISYFLSKSWGLLERKDSLPR